MLNLNHTKLVLAEKQRTRKWLAEQLGKSVCTVSKWYSNTVQPDIITLEKIAQLLGANKKRFFNANQYHNQCLINIKRCSLLNTTRL